MSYFKKLLQILLTLVAALQLTACSRTVHWEEEVPLNTGETIVVKRSGTYTYESESGNPLKFDYRPDWRSTIEFTYKGKRYTHTDDAGLVLLAIAPDGTPNLVASAAQYGWGNKHKYLCDKPYYAQFRPDSSRKNWNWPEKIDPWIYGLPTNLVFGLPPLASSGKKYTQTDRVLENGSLLVMDHYRRIDPNYEYQNCMRRK